jgi:hypothetical protein
MEYNCNECKKNIVHNKKFHNTQSNIIGPIVVVNNKNSSHNVPENDKILICKYCNKCFQNRSNRWRPEKKCTNKETEIKKLEKIKLEKIEKEIELEKTKEKNIQLEEIINKLSLPMNNQLINIIEDKNKKNSRIK